MHSDQFIPIHIIWLYLDGLTFYVLIPISKHVSQSYFELIISIEYLVDEVCMQLI